MSIMQLYTLQIDDQTQSIFFYFLGGPIPDATRAVSANTAAPTNMLSSAT